MVKNGTAEIEFLHIFTYMNSLPTWIQIITSMDFKVAKNFEKGEWQKDLKVGNAGFQWALKGILVGEGDS